MISQLLQKLFQRSLSHSDPEKLRTLVYMIQAIIGALVIGGLVLLRERAPKSGFKVRESDLRKGRNKAASGPAADDPLASAKLASFEKKQAPLRLAGIVLSGPPHEVLGISARASESEIKLAYRELMKRYHPDLVGRPGSREWNDAQKIAEALNQAKEKMLAALKTR